MTFLHIPTNAAVMIDANIFIYFFTPHAVFGPPCQMLMDRITKYQDFLAYTSTHIVSEVSHQLMALEASQVLSWPLGGITRRLAQHSAEIKKLTRFAKPSMRFRAWASKFCLSSGICCH
jgi:hypothetical protein